MAYENDLETISLPAAADLSAKQYYLIKVDSSGNAALAGEGSDAVGVLQNAPAASGRAATVAYHGVTKVVAGGSFNPGDRLSPDSNGKAVAVGSSDDYALGVALAAGTSGTITTMLITPIGKS